MSEQKIRLQKGTQINIGGKDYKVAQPIYLKVFKGALQGQSCPVKGNHQSDKEAPIDKEIVCRFLHQKIEDLEKKENKILMDLDEAEEGARITDHVVTTRQIMFLKEVLKELKTL